MPMPLVLSLRAFLLPWERDMERYGIIRLDRSAADEANLLFGLTGQTAESMARDMELGLAHFRRLCVNIMCENSTNIQPDRAVIGAFLRELYPRYKDDPRVDILLCNTDFGVGD